MKNKNFKNSDFEFENSFAQEEEDYQIECSNDKIPFVVKLILALLGIAALSFIGATISVLLINHFGK